MKARSTVRRLFPTALALICAFAAGWVAAGQAFATKVNFGLLNALNHVGGNLFGDAVFEAVTPTLTPQPPPDTY